MNSHIAVEQLPTVCPSLRVFCSNICVSVCFTQSIARLRELEEVCAETFVADDLRELEKRCVSGKLRAQRCEHDTLVCVSFEEMCAREIIATVQYARFFVGGLSNSAGACSRQFVRT